MPRCVHKFPVAIDDRWHTINVRSGAKFLAAAMQGEDLCLWFEHEPDKPVEGREFRVFGTGHPITGETSEWRATVMAAPFVWHVYENC